MSIVRREIELAVRIGHEPREMSVVGIIAWQSDVEVLAMRSVCVDRDGGGATFGDHKSTQSRARFANPPDSAARATRLCWLVRSRSLQSLQ